MVSISHIDSLTNFKRDTAKYLRQMARTKKPLALTVNGKAEWVVMNRKLFEQYEEYLEYVESMAAIKRGLADVKAGRVRPAREAIIALAKKHKIPLPQ